MTIRPDINDLLFLGSFPFLFQRIESNNNKKNKRKNMQKGEGKCKICRKKCLFLKEIMFPRFFKTFLTNQCT